MARNKNRKEEPQYLSVKEFASEVRYSPRHILRCISSGKLKASRAPERRKWQIPFSEVSRFRGEPKPELTEPKIEPKAPDVQIPVQNECDPIITRRRGEHFDHLAEIAQYLLTGNLERILPDSPGTEVFSKTYTVYSDEEEEISREELTLRLDGNIENAIHHYGPSDFLDSFVPHLTAECLGLKPGKLDEVVSNNPYILVDTVRILSQRKTFKGNCPVCKDWQ